MDFRYVVIFMANFMTSWNFSELVASVLEQTTCLWVCTFDSHKSDTNYPR
jgi:hypothetical protein